MKRVLLLVDDEADLGLLFRRLVARWFDEVHVATGSAAAEEQLDRCSVTHLVVDSVLDHGGALGQDLVPGWRRKHPSIVYAALFSGRDLERERLPAEVDETFTKPQGLDALLARLRSN